jgi:hypothetical protein
MRFNYWTVEQLIQYLGLSKVGMDYTCKTMVSGEIHIYNGESKKEEDTVDDDTLL